jgi:hypothetical protein
MNKFLTQFKSKYRDPRRNTRRNAVLPAWGLSRSCGHRTLGSSQEICPSSWGTVSNGLIFLWKTDRMSRPPVVGSSCRVSPLSRSHPDCQRCALACSLSVAPGCLRRQMSLSLLWHLSATLGKRLPSGDSCARYRVGSRRPRRRHVRPPASPGPLRRPWKR